MLLNKPLLIFIFVLLLTLASSGYYIKKLLTENAIISEEILVKDSKINEMNSSMINQEIRFKETLRTLEVRESKIKLIESHNINLKKKVQEISNEKSDVCINAAHNKSIVDILHNN